MPDNVENELENEQEHEHDEDEDLESEDQTDERRNGIKSRTRVKNGPMPLDRPPGGRIISNHTAGGPAG